MVPSADRFWFERELAAATRAEIEDWFGDMAGRYRKLILDAGLHDTELAYLTFLVEDLGPT